MPDSTYAQKIKRQSERAGPRAADEVIRRRGSLLPERRRQLLESSEVGRTVLRDDERKS